MTGHSHLAFSEMVNYSDENNTACRMIHNSSTSQLRVYKIIPTACYIFPSYVEKRSAAAGISITVPPAKTVYNEGEYFNAAVMAVAASYPDGTTKQVQGWGIEDNTALSKDDAAVTIVYGNLKATVPVKIRTITDGFAGSGTKDDPYLIQNEDDFKYLTISDGAENVV